MMAIATIWSSVPIFFLIKSIISKEDASFGAFVFTAIGIYFFLHGFNELFTRTVTEFDGETFYYQYRSLLRYEDWHAPLSEYEGVLARNEYHSENDSSYTLYIVELLHPDKQRRIKLWQSNWSSGHRANWKRYCRQLGLPGFWQGEESEKYITRYDPDDLGKSVRELAVESKLDITFNHRAAVPKALELNRQGGQLEIVIHESKMPIWFLVMPTMLGCSAFFIWFGFFSKFNDVCIGVIGVVTMWGIIRASITTPLVRINRKGLHILRRSPWGETEGDYINADAIENVRVGKTREDLTDQSPISRAVVVETDVGDYTIGQGSFIGQGLDDETLEWLKNCILSMIAK